MNNGLLDTNMKYYILTLDNGIQKEQPVEIAVFNVFNDDTKLVQLNGNIFGLLKMPGKNISSQDLDSDIIKSDIAELLDINHENSFRIANSSEVIGIFTELNYRKDIETRISATTAISHLIENINNRIIYGEEYNWIIDTLNIPQDFTGNGISDKQKIKNIIELGIFALKQEIEMNAGRSLDSKSLSSLRKNYLRMIIFDLIVERKHRGLDYYFISSLNNNNTPVYYDAHFGPISVSTSKDKNIVQNKKVYYFNNKLIRIDSLLEVLFENYYDDIKKLTESVSDAKNLYEDAINRIIYNNTDINNAIDLDNTIKENIKRIYNIQEEKYKELNNNKKRNKVEATMATQSLNVRVTAKLDLIQKKYPLNPNQHTDIIEKHKKDRPKEKLKLIVENYKDSEKGFINSAILIALIGLICGIGIGIVYAIVSIV